MDTSILDEKLTLVSFRFSQFSGYRRATRELIVKLGGHLPACKAITEGSIKVFPNDGLKAFNTIRRRLSRYLQERGVQAMGSATTYAIPTTEIADVEKMVLKTEDDFAVAKVDLERAYDSLFEDHVQANQEAEVIIRDLQVDKVSALAKCRFDFNVFRVQAVARAGETKDKSLENLVRGFSRRLYEEVAAEFEKLSETDNFVRLRVGQRTIVVVKVQINKMKRLQFLDDSVPYAVMLGESIVGRMPTQGYIEGYAFEVLNRYVEVMSDPDRLLNSALLMSKGIDPIEILFPPKAEAVQAIAQPQLLEQPVVENSTTPVIPKVVPKAVPKAAAKPVLLPVAGRQVPKMPSKPSVPLPGAGMQIPRIPHVPGIQSKPGIPTPLRMTKPPVPKAA